MAKSLELKLPVPDVDPSILVNPEEPEQVSADNDPENNYYLEYVATNGSINIGRSRHMSQKTVSWRILQKNQVIELEAVDLNNIGLPARRKIRLRSPLVLRRNCFTIMEDAADNTLCIDFLVEQGFLYTVVLPLTLFSNDEVKLNDSNASQWRGIKSPFSFDIRRPHLMRAVSPSTLVAALQDGAIVKLHRDLAAGKLSEIRSTVLADPKSGLSLGMLLPWSYSDKVPGTNISVRTVSSLDYSAENDSIIGICINRTIRVWSLASTELIAEQSISGPLLSTVPCRLVTFSKQHPQNRKRGLPNTLVAIYIPGGNGQNGYFKIFQYNYGRETGMVLVDLGSDFEVPEYPPEEDFSLWMLADLSLVDYNDHLKLWTLWKSDLNSSVCYFTLPVNSGSSQRGWTSVETHDVTNTSTSDFPDSSSEDLSEVFVEKMFGPSGYSIKTIETALPIYCQHHQGKVAGPRGMNLKDKVCLNVGASVSMSGGSSTGPGYSANDYLIYRQELVYHWMKFDRLCLELEKQACEVFSMVYDENIDLMWLSRSSHVSVLRRMTDIEIYSSNCSVAPSNAVINLVSRAVKKEPVIVERILRFLAALSDFRRGLSRNILHNMEHALEDEYRFPPNYLVVDRMAARLDEFLSNQVSDSSIGTLATAIFEIPDADLVLQAVFDAFSSSFEDHPDNTNSRASLPLSAFGAQFFAQSLKGYSAVTKPIALDCLLLLLLSVEQEELISEYAVFYPKYLGLLKALDAFCFLVELLPHTVRIQTKFDVIAKLDDLSVSDHPRGPSAVEIICSKAFQDFSINGHSTAFALLRVLSEFNIVEAPISRACILVYLSLKGYDEELIEFSNSFVNVDDVFSQFVSGLVLFKHGQHEEATIVLRSVGVWCATHQTNEQEQSILHDLAVRDSTHFLGRGISVYYLWVAKFALSNNGATTALEFSRLAAETANGVSSELCHEIYLTWFQASLANRSFDDGYNAIVELQLANCPQEKLVQCLDTFISSITIAGKGQRLCQFPFIGITQTVTALLEEKARADPAGSKIPYHRLLYSWKVEKGDFRGGMFCGATAAIRYIVNITN